MKLVVITGDPRISRIDKIFGENGPKFLDLYASIYGMFKITNFLCADLIGPLNVLQWQSKQNKS